MSSGPSGIDAAGVRNIPGGIILRDGWSPSASQAVVPLSQGGRSPMSYQPDVTVRNVVALLALAVVAKPTPRAAGDPVAAVAVSAKLSEWKVELSERSVAPGPVTFTVTNEGSIPHALEVQGQGIG